MHGVGKLRLSTNNSLYLANDTRQGHKGVTPSKFRRALWRQKIKTPGLSYGVVYVILCLIVLVQCWLVADRQTDIQTDT